MSLQKANWCTIEMYQNFAAQSVIVYNKKHHANFAAKSVLILNTNIPELSLQTAFLCTIER